MQIALRRRDQRLQILRHIIVPDGEIVAGVGVVDDPQRNSPAGLPAVGVGLADDALHGDRRFGHLSSSIGLRTSDGSGPDRAVERAARRPVCACAFAAAVTLALASCEADAIAARAILAEWGYHGIAIQPAPVLGRPCRWGEPFAVRFRAMREDGSPVSGIVCAADENAEDARLLVDAEGSR